MNCLNMVEPLKLMFEFEFLRTLYYNLSKIMNTHFFYLPGY